MRAIVDTDRVVPLNLDEPRARRPVVYWMSRDARAVDNWALLYAQEQALALHAPLVAAFCADPSYPSATPDHWCFLLEGLSETAGKLAARQIPFTLLEGDPRDAVPRLLFSLRAGMLVTDFDPLRHKIAWVRKVAQVAGVACRQVDAHNIVPCHVASDHAEIGARTLRPKLHRALPQFLTPFPALRTHPHALSRTPARPDFDRWLARFRPRVRQDLRWAPPGTAAALRRLRAFLRDGLPRYAEQANDPNAHACSGLSPYLHFGQLSAQRVALAVRDAGLPEGRTAAFLEQLVVRRELADNFCTHTPGYDSPGAAPAWARRTLARHAEDAREGHYSTRALEAGETADPLWNAAQRRLLQTGRLHGYVRMYWAKRLLAWCPGGAHEALALAIDLNDRLALDGRDPNGYTNIAWSLLGMHDRPWPERPIFGMIRTMTANGCRTKFDVNAFIGGAP